MVPTVRALVERGIPVVGHLGPPAAVGAGLGGYKVQGRQAQAAEQLVLDARRWRAGASMLVLETGAGGAAGKRHEGGAIPTVGIGAGRRV
jgi:3-methyl-2-oxobutanoate hydroxymethyltransferase